MLPQGPPENCPPPAPAFPRSVRDHWTAGGVTRAGTAEAGRDASRGRKYEKMHLTSWSPKSTHFFRAEGTRVPSELAGAAGLCPHRGRGWTAQGDAARSSARSSLAGVCGEGPDALPDPGLQECLPTLSTARLPGSDRALLLRGFNTRLREPLLPLNSRSTDCEECAITER